LRENTVQKANNNLVDARRLRHIRQKEAMSERDNKTKKHCFTV